MGRVVAVVAPDPADARRSGRACRAQASHERDMQGDPTDARPLRRVDHELVQRRVVEARIGESRAVALAHPDPLDGHERSLEEGAELGQRRRDAWPGPDRDDHERHAGVAPDEARAVTHAVCRPVDAEQHRRAGDARAAQDFDDRLVRRAPAGRLMAAQVDRQLRLLVQGVGQRVGRGALGHEPRPFRRHEPVEAERRDVFARRLDERTAVDGDRDERQVLGEREQPSVRSACLAPKPVVPRMTRLVARPWRAKTSTSASARKPSPARSRSPKWIVSLRASSITGRVPARDPPARRRRPGRG